MPMLSYKIASSTLADIIGTQEYWANRHDNLH